MLCNTNMFTALAYGREKNQLLDWQTLQKQSGDNTLCGKTPLWWVEQGVRALDKAPYPGLVSELVALTALNVTISYSILLSQPLFVR